MTTKDTSTWDYARCAEYVRTHGLTIDDTRVRVALSETATRAVLIEAIQSFDPDPYTGEHATNAELRELLRDLVASCDPDMAILRDACAADVAKA